MLVWLNGTLVERDKARVSVFDAGFQHGVGLFETMLARHGTVFRAQAHMQRLQHSAHHLLLTERLRIEPLIEALHLTLQRNALQDARVRLTITGGDLNMLQTEGRSQAEGDPIRNASRMGTLPTLLIVAQPPTVYPQAFFDKGVVVTIADGRANPLDPMAGHKTLNYWPRIQALQHAAARRAGEALWFTVSNHLAGGCVSNVFLVKDGALLTPIARGEEEQGAMPAPVLPGVTRSAVIELAERLDLAVTTRMLDINDVLRADEVFLTNSSWGVLPVVGVEREKIGTGEVGEATTRLRRAWDDLVEQEAQASDL